MSSNIWLYIALGFFTLIIVAALVLAFSLYSDYKVVKSRKVAAPVLGVVKEEVESVSFAQTNEQERDDKKPTRRFNLRKPKAETIQVNPIWGHQEDQELPDGSD